MERMDIFRLLYVEGLKPWAMVAALNREPYRIEVYEEDVIYVIKSVEKIRCLDILKKTREEII
jgi:hypothetical protein